MGDIQAGEFCTSEIRSLVGEMRGRGRMDREYDIFERLPDGSILWRTVIKGFENALAALTKLGGGSPNEHFAIHTPTNTIIARVNEPEADAPES
jgi:hypothetical protein